MTTADEEPEVSPEGCRPREVLDIVGDKWSLLVVRNLKDGPRRFTELKRGIDGISQRMLTVTLRSLERDGILTRTVHNVMPPNVTAPLLEWSSRHLALIDAARAEYDARTETPPPTENPGDWPARRVAGDNFWITPRPEPGKA
jgi:DNA-binding HxlR family transcriptional regulator